MDDIDAPLNRSNDDAEMSKSSDEHSFIGKMKSGVSKILPNSLSKWLSPKVDANNARRRRYDEIDSEEEAHALQSQSGANTAGRYQNTPQIPAQPPNKRKKTFTDFLASHTLDTNSPAPSPLLGERSNIASSTLIEDVPHRRNNQFNRFLPHENGASAAFADDSVRDNASNGPDEASASTRSRDKPVNPFTINNESSVVNFSAHLQRAKSLFSNRSYVSPRLRNYRMRNPRSSLYRSTSSLGDNNSMSSNASSAMSSPFYNGQTTFGGASATSRRIAPQNHDWQMSTNHRPKVPTNLVTSRSTSSLNATSDYTHVSNTTRRIIDIVSRYNTPLNEARRITNILPAIAETSLKQNSVLNLESGVSDFNKSKSFFAKTKNPYYRPFGRHPAESMPTSELHVPSMPELLQLNKFAANTIKIRDLANNSESALNKPVPMKANEFKLVHTPAASSTDGDLDASNNNKSVNAIANSANEAMKHKNKLRCILTKQNRVKRRNDDEPPEPVNMPSINSFVLDKKAQSMLIETLKPQITEPKPASATNNGLQVPFKFNSVPTLDTKQKRLNGNDESDDGKALESSVTKPALLTPTPSFSAHIQNASTNLANKPEPVKVVSKPAAGFQFAQPIVVQQSAQPFKSIPNMSAKTRYEFSDPKLVDNLHVVLSKAETVQSVNNFKFESKSIKSNKSDSGFAETTQSFGSNASKSTGLFAVKPTFEASKDNGLSAVKSVSSISSQLKSDDTFKSLVAQQKQHKWSCRDCFASNESTLSKCACCGASKESTAPGKTAQTQPAAPVDGVFKSIVAKQKQAKWECQDCLAQNDQTQSKCCCCGGDNPSATSDNVTDSKAAPPKPTFSFGWPAGAAAKAAETKPMDNVFKSIVAKQKSSWECSACLSQNDESKSKCVCCEQSRDVTTGATAAPLKSQSTFGSAAASGSFSFGSNASSTVSKASTFSFGNLPAKTTGTPSFTFGKASESTVDSNGKSDDDKAKETVQKAPASFVFGNASTSSKVEATPSAPVAADTMFKSIVEKQKSESWECSACMTKNATSVEKCVCCDTPKDGKTVNDNTKKETSAPLTSKFSFGSPAASSFSFGSKPASTPSFGATSSTTTATPVAAPAASTSAFGSSSEVKPSFSFMANKPTTESTQPAAAALGSFKFSFGSNTAAPSTSPIVSKDVTDMGATSTAPKSISVLENVLVRPASNGPIDAPKPMFPFALSAPADDSVSKAKKRSSTDQPENSILTKFPAPSAGSTPFVFGQPTPATSSFGAIGSNASTSAVPQANAASSRPAFSFGATNSSTSSFPSAQPASSPFSFSTPAAVSTTSSSTFGAAATPLNTTSQPVFGSNAFASPSSAMPTLPALGGFKADNAFGSSAPAFGAPAQAPPSNSISAGPGVFQFVGGSAAPEPPKPSGFNFSIATPASFNFSDQTPQQTNQPFQFGGPTNDAAAPNIFSAQPAASTTTQGRKKVRAFRRINRP